MIGVIGAGSNLGARQSILDTARHLLSARGIRVERRSATYRSPAMVLVGRSPGPEFLNEAWRVRTSHQPQRLLRELHAVEAILGRQRGERWGARTLDLDILWLERPHTSAELEVPHPGLTLRPFALTPLLDVAPELSEVYRPLTPPKRARGSRAIRDGRRIRAQGPEALALVLQRALYEPVLATQSREIAAPVDQLARTIASAGLQVRAVAQLPLLTHQRSTLATHSAPWQLPLDEAALPTRVRLVLTGSAGTPRRVENIRVIGDEVVLDASES